MAFAMNNSNESRLRHIDSKFLRAKDRVRDQLVTFEHIRTESMIADLLTKALPVAIFKGHVSIWGSLKNECIVSLLCNLLYMSRHM